MGIPSRPIAIQWVIKRLHLCSANFMRTDRMGSNPISLPKLTVPGAHLWIQGTDAGAWRALSSPPRSRFHWPWITWAQDRIKNREHKEEEEEKGIENGEYKTGLTREIGEFVLAEDEDSARRLRHAVCVDFELHFRCFFAPLSADLLLPVLQERRREGERERQCQKRIFFLFIFWVDLGGAAVLSCLLAKRS